MKRIFLTIFPIVTVLCLSAVVNADVKIKQRMTMAGQKFESTRMIKGSRERTEQKIEMADPNVAAFMPQIATVTQCDMKRTLRINDRKQLYLVEPFPTAADAAAANRPAAPSNPLNTTTRKGGTMTITYSFRDTGERKMMFGLQARRLIMTHEMESSADSCAGPSKTKMEFDGWYADFSAEFSCPINLPPSQGVASGKPDCIDRIITKGNGAAAARTGFLLEGTMTMYGPDGKVTMTQTTETLELSRESLQAGLFDIPQGYTAAASTQELYAMPSPTDIARSVVNTANTNRPSPSESGAPAAKSVAVNVTFGPSVTADQAQIESYVMDKIRERGLRAQKGGSGDYTLNLQVRQAKESAAGKIGGLFGKVTGVDTGKIAKVDVDLSARLVGTTREAQVKSKFDGPATEAVRAALDRALDELLDDLK